MSVNGNQLTAVNDAATASAYNGGFEFKNGANAANEYAYDANGNLTKDLNKNITDIQYNFLNLPSQITFDDGSTIVYLYSADGTKLRTTHTISGTVTTTDYCNNVIYENNTATQLLTEAGYVSLNDNKYHYYLQDHQGNNRVVIDQNGTVEETNHYYPFGGAFACTKNAQPYKYNGKEFDSEKGLNWYDYGARHYDAALGRFTTIDPVMEKFYAASPYAYCANNPIRYVDPTGMEFTEESWKQINRLIDDINKRQASNTNDIAKKQAQIDAGGLSDKKIARLQKQMNKLNDNTAELEAVRGEVATLEASSQMYDIYSDNSMNINGTIPGIGEYRSGAVINSANGNFDIKLGDGSLGMLAHELKHAYQFETGSFSSGRRRDGTPFYDQSDEWEAYSRGSLFGAPRINTLPALYNNLEKGPMDATKLAPIILSSPAELQKLANRTYSSFRVNGVTYMMQERK